MLWLGGCAPAPQQFDGPTMGTTYSVTVTQLPDGVTREALQSVIDGVLDEVDRHLSTYDPTSEISAFNARRSTEAVPVSPQLHAVVALALLVGVDTGGAFDITVGPLVRAWGFGGGRGTSASGRDAADGTHLGRDRQARARVVERRSFNQRRPGPGSNWTSTASRRAMRWT